AALVAPSPFRTRRRQRGQARPGRQGGKHAKGPDGVTSVHTRPGGQASPPPTPHAPAPPQEHWSSACPRHGARVGKHLWPTGHPPPHGGKGPSLQSVPGGSQVHSVNGNVPVCLHVPPAGHSPLHTGDVSPHGWSGWMQTQVVNDVATS